MSSKKARVAIIGVGNCASRLVQGIQFYKDTEDERTYHRSLFLLLQDASAAVPR